MKKHLLAFLAMLVSSIGLASAATGTDWTSTYTNINGWKPVLGITNSSDPVSKWTDTSNNFKAEWTIDCKWTNNSKTSYQTDKNGLRFGAGKSPLTELKITTSSFAGKTINSVIVLGAWTTGTTSESPVTVTVGGVTYKCGTSSNGTPGTSQTAGKDLVFEGESTGGDIVITFKVTSGKQVGLKGLTVNYSNPTGDTLGEIKVTYGTDNKAVTNGDVLEAIPVGTEFKFSAEKATNISVSDTDTNGEIASGTFSATWTASTATPANELTVTATNGTETKTFTFTVEVVKPIVGNVVTTPAAVNEDITVTSGSVITFSAENADKLAFKVDDEAEETVDNPYTYTPAKDVIVTVTPVDNGTKVEDKTAVFTITIKQAEVWTLVTSLRDMPLDGQYIIANNDGTQAMSTEKNTDYRKITSITVKDNQLTDPSDNVLRFTLEKGGDNGEYYFWKTVNYGGSKPEVYLNSNASKLYASEPEDTNLENKNSKVDFKNGNVTIEFVKNSRTVRFNSDRFQGYDSYNANMANPENLTKLFRLGGTPMPTRTQNADGSVVYVSTVGELHVIVENRDENNKPIAAAGQSMMARAASENPWTNKVADANVEYTIHVPVEPVHHIYVEAKSVNGTFHSEVDKFTLDQSGTTTGITAVETEDTDAPVEYYNMQGVRVMNPAQGLYIRRQGNRVEKVALR